MLFENLVASVEQCKTLRELGIEQITSFYWTELPISKQWKAIPYTSSTLDLSTAIAAYCDTELAIMLDAFYGVYINVRDKWSAMDASIGDHPTPAQAGAAHLIWMLENDERLTVEIANQRLMDAKQNLIMGIIAHKTFAEDQPKIIPYEKELSAGKHFALTTAPFLIAKLVTFTEQWKAEDFKAQQLQYIFRQVQGYNIFFLQAGFSEVPKKIITDREIEKALDEICNCYFETEIKNKKWFEKRLKSTL